MRVTQTLMNTFKSTYRRTTSISGIRAALNHFSRVVFVSSCRIIGFEFNVYGFCCCWCYTLDCFLCTNKIMGSCKAIEQNIMQGEYLDVDIAFYLQWRKISCETHCCFLCFLLPSKLFSNLFFSGFCLFSTLVCFCFHRLLDFEKVTANEKKKGRKVLMKKESLICCVCLNAKIARHSRQQQNKRGRPHPQDVNSKANTNREFQGV